MIAWGPRFRASLDELAASIEGLDPEQTALLMAVGLVLGVFPMMGLPTLLCLAAAGALRLNAAALLLLNNLTSPLQLALLAPFARAGGWLCGNAPADTASVAGKLGMAALHAVVGWTSIAIPCGAALYFLLGWLMRKHRQPWCHPAESPA
jgi:hypothetical protein